MTFDAVAYLWQISVVFCRIGTAMILMPGFSSPRFPPQVRIFLSLCVSVAISPYILMSNSAGAPLSPGENIATILLAETLTGLMLGFWAACFVHAVRFAGTFITNAIGLAGIPGQPVDDTEASALVSTLLSIAASMVILASELHLLSLQALLQSYKVVGIGELSLSDPILDHTLKVLQETFVLALRLCSPFIVFVTIVNGALGLANRFTPQLPVYFATLGTTTLVGLLLLGLLAPQLMNVFGSRYQSWLESGIL